MTQPLTVLIVEDDPLDAELLVLQLARGGYAAEWERVDTPEAFTRALGPGLDVIFSDYRMPTFRGLEALRLLRDNGLDIPFILISGSADEADMAAAESAGAADFLLKDNLARLGEAVAQALAQRRS
ncbi:MAG: response regulator [Anaerolineales bacterium]